MKTTITQVDITNPDDWNRFANDDLVKNSQLAEYLGIPIHAINNNRDIMPKIHIKGKPIFYKGSDVNHWINQPENREFLKRYRKNDVRVEQLKETHINVVNPNLPKFSVVCMNNCFVITIPFNDIPMNQFHGMLQHCA